MATISACTPTSSSIPRAALVQKSSAARPSAAVVLGLPSMKKGGRVSCSSSKGGKAHQESDQGKVGMTSAVAAAAAAMWSPAAAMALVDERLSTEGTGLPFGLSNNLLIWIIVGVFGLIWALYITYTSGLDEDEESGLSL